MQLILGHTLSHRNTPVPPHIHPPIPLRGRHRQCPRYSSHPAIGCARVARCGQHRMRHRHRHREGNGLRWATRLRQSVVEVMVRTYRVSMPAVHRAKGNGRGAGHGCGEGAGTVRRGASVMGYPNELSDGSWRNHHADLSVRGEAGVGEGPPRLLLQFGV